MFHWEIQTQGKKCKGERKIRQATRPNTSKRLYHWADDSLRKDTDHCIIMQMSSDRPQEISDPQSSSLLGERKSKCLPDPSYLSSLIHGCSLACGIKSSVLLVYIIRLLWPTTGEAISHICSLRLHLSSEVRKEEESPCVRAQHANTDDVSSICALESYIILLTSATPLNLE